MSGTLAFRLRIRNAADSADLLTFSTLATDTSPYLQGPPSGDGQRIDPIKGTSSIGAYTVRVVDVSVNGTRAVTSNLVDANKRQQLISRRAYIESSEDEGDTWDVMVAGYVNRVRLVGALVYEFSIGETQRVEQSLEIFKSVTATYDQVSCICGGPVKGGFGPLHDYGPWKMRVAQVYADKFVRLKYLSGYQRRSVDTITDFHPLGGYEYVAGGISRYEDSRVNQLSRPYYEPLPGYSANGIAGWYPRLVVRVEEADGTLVGTFRPMNRIDSTITVGSITIVGPHVALVDNSDLNVLWDGTHHAGTGTAPDQPDDEAIYYVYVYPEEVDENNPIHISGHPVEIITGLWDDAGLAYSTADAATAKTAIGSALRYDLRITKSYKLGDFVSQICAISGLGVRFNTSGERSLVSLRIPPSTSPTTTITLDDLRGVGPSIFDVDEKSVVDKVTFRTETYSAWSPEKYGEDSAHPIDELVVTPQTASVTAEDTDGEHEQAFEIQGQIRVTGLPGFFQDLAWLGSGLNQAGVFAVSRAREIFDRRVSGAIVGEIECVRGVDAVPGDEIILDLDHMPNDNDRGGERIVQVLGRTETPGGPTLYVEDAGTSVQPSTVPTYTIAKDTTADPKRYATIALTNASSLITDGSSARIEMAEGSSPSSWVHFATITPTEMATVTSWRSPRFDAGSVANVRMRAEEPGKRPSAYGDTESVTLTALTAPTSLSAVAVTDDDTAADLTWTAGETLLPVTVEWRETADTVYDHHVVLPAGSTQYRVRGLTPSVGYTFRVKYREEAPFTGESTAITDTLTTGSTTPTCSAPDNPRIFAGSVDPATGGLVVDGSYGLEITATELPSFTVFEVSVEGEGGNLLFDWSPGDSTTGFARTGAAPYVDSDLEVASAATGVARDADYSTGERGLILEPARTNSIADSDDISDTGSWTLSAATVTTDDVSSADGSTGDLLVESTTNDWHELRYALPSHTDATGQAAVVDVSPGGRTWCSIGAIRNESPAVKGYVNLSTGAVVQPSSGGSIATQMLADDRVRIRLKWDELSGSNATRLFIRTAKSGTEDKYTGDGTSGIHIWRAAYYADGAYCTTPVGTTGSTAGMGAESLTRSGVMTSGISATRYDRYYDLATEEVVETATAITTGTDVAFTVGRVYYRVKIAAGTYTVSEMRDLVSAGTYGDYLPVPRGTVQSVQGARTVWRGLAPNDGKRRQIRAKHTAPGKDDSAYTPAVNVDPWSAVRPHDYPVDIPTDFTVGSVVLGSQTGGASYAVATYTPPAVTTGFHHMAYSVRSRQTTPGSSAQWGAPSLVTGGAYGSDHIPVTPGSDVEITPITVSDDGTGHRGTGSEVKTVAVPQFSPAAFTVADPVATSSAITYEITDFGTTAYVRWWHKTYTSGTVPSSAVSVENVGTEGPRFEPGGLSVQQGGAIDATNQYELATFVPYDANNQRGTPVIVKTQRATPTAPSAPASAAASSHTGSTVTNSVTMPASITNADYIRVYRDGVRYGGDVARTASASSAQSVVSTDLSPGTAYLWQYSLVSSAGAESAKTTAISVTTSASTVPTPSCSLSYSAASQSFTVHVLPGVDSPSGVTWHLKIGTSNPPTTEATGSASTASTLSYASAQTSSAVTYYAKVWGVKAGWTKSSDSSVASASRPALSTGGGGGGPPIDPT